MYNIIPALIYSDSIELFRFLGIFLAGQLIIFAMVTVIYFTLINSYVDNFAFCCMVGLTAAGTSSSPGCFAPVDQFSSCDDLLKDGALRTFMWILGLSALVGNAFVIGLRLFRSKAVIARVNEKSRIQSRLITNLAVSDFIMGLYMIIIGSVDLYYRGDYAINADAWRNSGACQFAGIISAFSSEVSVFLITLISIDRLVCIVFSHHRVIKFSYKSSMVSLGIIWVLGLIISLIPLAFDQFYGRSSVCLGLPLTTDRPDGWGYSVTIFLVLNFLCFVVTLCSYIVIYAYIVKARRKMVSNKTITKPDEWV